MYLKEKVKIPRDIAGITHKKIKGTEYVYYVYGHRYDSKKKHTVPLNTTIGKRDSEDPSMMFPNTNYLRFFPDEELPDMESGNDPGAVSTRSGCLRIGAFIIIKQIIDEYGLDQRIQEVLGEDAGLFLDLAAYSIVTENNAAQYYPDYAYNHPLFTEKMRSYSDSKVSRFLCEMSRDASIDFQNEWNRQRDHREKIYISYDSTNKNCQAGDIDFVEYGCPKDDHGKLIINYSIAYDTNNAIPLFYEEYPGSIVDISQLQYMLDKAQEYGYQHVGFILDRGYFSKENIHYMDKCGYEFVIMMKGLKDLAKEVVSQVKGTFEESREHSIRHYKVSGITVKHQLYPSDKRERYFHVYYSNKKKTAEQEKLESKIDRMAECLKKYEGKEGTNFGKGYEKYFDLIYSKKGEPDERFMYGREKHSAIDEEIKYCGYFVLITSESMTAKEALEVYKSTDASEKLFRGDKSYLGDKSFRVHKNESIHAKIFVEFVALIIRNRIHTYVKDHKVETGKKRKYYNVPAVIRELEKIEMIRMPGGTYQMSHSPTEVQKDILKVFGLTAKDIAKEAVKINEELTNIGKDREYGTVKNDN